MPRLTPHRLWMVILLGVLTTSAARARVASLDLQPPSPTDQYPITVLVHIDAHSWCGSAVAASPVKPQDTSIYLWMVPADVESSCPASEEPIVVSVPIGRLDAGAHTVLIWEAAQTGPNGHNATLLDSLAFTVAAGPSSTLLLHGRFEATVSWRAFDGSSGVGHVVPGSSQESGLFWFFGPGNWELLVKVLDACAVNGHFWVLGAGGTNVEFTVEIEDVLTHQTWTYTNPSGHPAGSFFDTAAFAGACISPPPGS
jgi:hypothetical protein